MTTREKLEAKLEKRESWAVSRRESAHAEFESADKLVENIPFGQPILIGHHSEKASRNLYKRVEQKTTAACESLNMAEHHESKAEGIRRALDKNIFSDDEDAIERLEEKIADLQKSQEAMKTVNKICRDKKTTVEEKTALIREVMPKITDESIDELLNPKYAFHGIGFPSYSLQNNNANINRLKKRIIEIKARRERAESAQRSESGVVVTGDEYIYVTFAEKPDRSVLNDLKAAGFGWSRGSWDGRRENLPESVKQMMEAPIDAVQED